MIPNGDTMLGSPIEPSCLPVLVVVLGLEPTAPGLGSALEHVGGSPSHVHAPSLAPLCFFFHFFFLFSKGCHGAAPLSGQSCEQVRDQGPGERVGYAEGRDDVDTL